LKKEGKRNEKGRRKRRGRKEINNKNGK